jgi:Acetyltransferase (GNAT) domain
MTSVVQLYDPTTIATLPWPDSEIAQLAQRYWLPMMQSGASHYIDNVQTQLLALTIDDLVLPVTVNDQAEAGNCYVCSFYAHYITYAQDELVNLKLPALETLLRFLLTIMGWLLKGFAIDRTVIVNNWLLSTNLYPDLSAAQIAAITQHLKQVFPGHAIAFRSIGTFQDKNLIPVFQAQGYQMLGSRQVYVADFKSPVLSSQHRQRMKRHLKHDRQLFIAHGYQMTDVAELAVPDMPRMVELYRRLYLQKYSFNNPQFNENFLRMASDRGFLALRALCKDGRIDGVVGGFSLNGVMTPPVVGYDTSLPQELGLYRMLSADMIQAGIQRGLISHQSAGVASFKRRRGFVGSIEYTAVYHQHLPRHRRWVWQLLACSLDCIAIPLIRAFKL